MAGNLPEATETLAEMQRLEVVKRIWAKDPTVWKEDLSQQRELTDRLGWLHVIETMGPRLDKLKSFADSTIAAGFRDVVLLGMGGSSLSSEVFRLVFGSAPGHPQLHVLDSTVPSTVYSITRSIDPAQTLFIVSSKSGTTVETISFLKYFYDLVECRKGSRGGDNFIAITDPGTPLTILAKERGFRYIFLNPADVGGRFSALSLFGLVPAALMGMDLDLLLHRANGMAQACAPGVPLRDNPGAWLGAVLGALTQAGRDKLTLMVSPSLSSFGLWVEQLIAESLGKDGKGIIPIAGEPMDSPHVYGEDRVFVYLRLERDDNAALDVHAQTLEDSGQPVLCLELKDRYDLGAEIFRWEFAIAVAGAVLGVHPFNQPNVQESKDNTAELLQTYSEKGSLPEIASVGSLTELLAQARLGDYLALMAFVEQSPEADAALQELREVVLNTYRLPTMVGYGPRYLHSTGQLHKGGGDNVLLVQFTSDIAPDLQVPGKNYTFGTLAAAQAIGDFQALERRGRRIARVHLDRDVVAGLSEVMSQISSTKG